MLLQVLVIRHTLPLNAATEQLSSCASITSIREYNNVMEDVPLCKTTYDICDVKAILSNPDKHFKIQV